MGDNEINIYALKVVKNLFVIKCEINAHMIIYND